MNNESLIPNLSKISNNVKEWRKTSKTIVVQSVLIYLDTSELSYESNAEPHSAIDTISSRGRI